MSAGGASLPSGFTPPCAGPLGQTANDAEPSSVLGEPLFEGAPPWILCDVGFRGSLPHPHPCVVIQVGNPGFAQPLGPCGSLTWHREAGTATRGAFDLRTAGAFAKSPRRSCLAAAQASLSEGISFESHLGKTPLTNGLCGAWGGGDGGRRTPPQVSSLATGLGPRTQGHMAGSECVPAPTFLCGAPEALSAGRHCPPLPAGAPGSSQCPWSGRGHLPPHQ